jgi:hypothetical protein
MFTDCTNWFLHITAVNVFAIALLLHSLAILVGSLLGDSSTCPPPCLGIAQHCQQSRDLSDEHQLVAQMLSLCSAFGGLVAFQVMNQHQSIPWLRRGAGYWYWFVEVWALVSVLWFTPLRLFYDERSPTATFTILSTSGIFASLLVGIVPVLPNRWQRKLLSPGIAQRLHQHEHRSAAASSQVTCYLPAVASADNVPAVAGNGNGLRIVEQSTAFEVISCSNTVLAI